MRKLIGIIGLVVCITLLPLAASAKSNSSKLNKERLEVGRALLEVTADNVAEILPYYTDDIEYHDPIVDIYGIGEMEPFLFQLFGATPDLITTVEDENAIDDTYMATWTMIGTFANVPYEAKGMSIIKFRDKSTDVYYQRDYYSEADIMAAIPFLCEAVAGFRGVYAGFVAPVPAPGLECPQLPAPPAE
ncbi:MAG: nuclear transport factor 2 family protein [Xanthomonadales bacterium]